MGQAAPVSIENVRMWRAPDHTRLVFDLSGPVEHKLFLLSSPHRVVIDIKNVEVKKLPELTFDGPFLSGVRTGQQGERDVRVVLDMKQASRPRSYLLKPYEQYGYRLVVDLEQAIVATPSETLPDAAPGQPAAIPSTLPKSGPLIVAIDAGHGGEDPGAIGRRYRTREKDVVLAIAKEVERLVRQDPSLKAVMTRSGDYFVPLRRRVLLAQQQNADLFISIHADSLPHSRARGSSVYALSQKGATSAQARVLADRENASDLIGGVDLGQADDILAKVLVDMSQTATISSSLELGQDLLGSLGGVGPVHISNVGQAGFAVLKSPVMPSVLIETTFISHPGEERKLRSRTFQKKMGRAIYEGIRRFAKKNRLRPRSSGTTVATSGSRRFHIVRRGDTLSEIAQRYQVNIAAIRFANDLEGNRLIIGKRLIIPN